MSDYEYALNLLDDELHSDNYELYSYLHDFISTQQAEIERQDKVIAELASNKIFDIHKLPKGAPLESVLRFDREARIKYAQENRHG